MVGRTRPGPVLITGCSSGIGRAAALSLHNAGFTVYATARRTETLAELRDPGLRTLALDVTDEQSMTTAVAAVEADVAAGSLPSAPAADGMPSGSTRPRSAPRSAGLRPACSGASAPRRRTSPR